jgi:hypothetical protein
MRRYHPASFFSVDSGTSILSLYVTCKFLVMAVQSTDRPMCLEYQDSMQVEFFSLVIINYNLLWLWYRKKRSVAQKWGTSLE